MTKRHDDDATIGLYDKGTTIMLNTNHTQNPVFTLSDQPQPVTARPRWRRWLRLSGIGGLSLLALAISWILLTNLLWTGLPTGQPAPSFQGTTLAGEQFDLAAYREQPVMLTFWSPDCFACRQELPTLQALSADPSNELQLITVVSHLSEAEVRQFVAEAGLTFPIIVDEPGTIAQHYDVSGIPFTYLIGPDGLIDQALIGAGAEGELAGTLTGWLHRCQIDEVCTVE